MQIWAHKSTCLGRDGANEMYEVVPSDYHLSFVRDRARYVLDALPVHLPSPRTKTYTETEVMAFFSVTTKHMSFERLFEETITTFGASARSIVDDFLRQTAFKPDPPSPPEGKPYLKLYPSIPHGYWWIDTSGEFDKIIRSYMEDLKGWSQKPDVGEGVEFKDTSLRDFAETYPQFARRYNRRLPDNRDFPPAIRFMELGAVPYSRPAPASADTDPSVDAALSRFDAMRSMQLFSKNLVRVLLVTGNQSASHRRLLRMIACAAYFVDALTALLKIHSITELSRAVFGTLRGYGKDGEYPPPAYIDWVPIALSKQRTSSEYGGWDAARKHHFRLAEACFFSYCRDFALGNLFTRNAMRSSAFRVDYIEKCIGGAFIRHRMGPVEIMHDQFWTRLSIDPKMRADHVTVSEAVSVYTPSFSGKALTENAKLVSVLADLLDTQTLPEGLLTSYITDVLRQLLLGVEMPLGWIRSHRINYFIMQKWKENLYSNRAEDIHVMAVTISRRVQDYVTEFGDTYEKFKQIPYADLYYTLNAASTTDYPRQSFGPTLIQETSLRLLMLDPCTQLIGSPYGTIQSIGDAEENFWLLCGGESFKSNIRVCEVRNRLYMQPGSNTYADSARLATSLDLNPLVFPPVERPKIGAPKSLFDAMIGLNLDRDSRSLEAALSVSARKVVKGVDYDLLQAFAVSVRTTTNETDGTVADALYQLLIHTPGEIKLPRPDDAGPPSRSDNYEFTDSLDDLYRSTVPFAAVPLQPLAESEAIIEQTAAQRDALFKAASLGDFAAAVNLTPAKCRIAYLVRGLVDNEMMGLKVVYSALRVTDDDFKIYLESIGTLHALAAELKTKKVKPAKINAILTDAADFIARRPEPTEYELPQMRIATDPTRRFIVAIPPPLLVLLQKIDPDYLVAINLVPVSSIRPHDRYLQSLAGSSFMLTFMDDRGRMMYAGEDSHQMPLYLIMGHPDITMPIFEQSEKLQQVLMSEQGVNSPSDRELDIIEIVDAREIRMEEQLELRVALVNDCFKSAKDGLTPAIMRLLERAYHKVCYPNGFSAIQPVPEVDDDPEAKRQRTDSSKKERHARLMIDVGEVNTVDEAIDHLMVGIEKLSGLKLKHTRVSFCFVALPTPYKDSALYSVVSPLSTAPQRVQRSHVMAIICGRNVYLTSTKPEK